MDRVDDGLRRYLIDGPDRDRLLGRMAGHAYERHAAELGGPSIAGHRDRVRGHLRDATFAAAVNDPRGNVRYLLADERSDLVAWVTPHREHRSTLFAPRRGAADYVRFQRARTPPGRWRPLDLGALRDAPSRAPARGIASAGRRAARDGPTR